MILKDPLTREEFEAGVKFCFAGDTMHPMKYKTPEELKGRHGYLQDNAGHICNVEKVTDTGFFFYGTFLGVHIEGSVLFFQCIALRTEPKNEKP